MATLIVGHMTSDNERTIYSRREHVDGTPTLQQMKDAAEKQLLRYLTGAAGTAAAKKAIKRRSTWSDLPKDAPWSEHVDGMLTRTIVVDLTLNNPVKLYQDISM